MRPQRMLAAGFCLAGLALLVGCDREEQAAVPPPQELTREASGHYCSMIIADHPGPKGQIHVTGRDKPYWFSSVRDTIAFTYLPEEPKRVRTIYVNDMGRATNWESPEPGTWIDARQAWYVIGSSRRGGMGALETVPFGEKPVAESFAADYGGRVVAFGDIPHDYVLGDAGETAEHEGQHGATP